VIWTSFVALSAWAGRFFIASLFIFFSGVADSVLVATAPVCLLQLLPLCGLKTGAEHRTMIVVSATSRSGVKNHAKESENCCCSVKHRSIRIGEAWEVYRQNNQFVITKLKIESHIA